VLQDGTSCFVHIKRGGTVGAPLGPPSTPAAMQPRVGTQGDGSRGRARETPRADFPPTTGHPTRDQPVNGASHRDGYGWAASWRLTHPPSNAPGVVNHPRNNEGELEGRLGSSIPPCTLHVLFTLFPECFAEVPHGTCPLSVIPLVFSLGRIAPPVFSL
jgi:hypothetical protein